MTLFVKKCGNACSHSLCTLTRARNGSEIFNKDTDFDTLTLIPVAEWYFFVYQFHEIHFNKITLHISVKDLSCSFQLLDMVSDSKQFNETKNKETLLPQFGLILIVCF